MNNRFQYTNSSHSHKQQGAILVISLIMLLVLTVIGVTGMRTTILEEKMAGNMRDRDIAFQAAEAALVDGEQVIDSLVSTGSFNGTNGRLGTANDDPNFFDTTTWSTTNSTAYSGTLSEVASQPRYIMKYVGRIQSNTGALNVGSYGSRNINIVNNFRITARGTGGSDTSQFFLQSYFGKIM